MSLTLVLGLLALAIVIVLVWIGTLLSARDGLTGKPVRARPSDASGSDPRGRPWLGEYLGRVIRGTILSGPG